MTRLDRITQLLTDHFSPTALTLTDESHLHKGHNGHTGIGETHFFVDITAPIFSGKRMIDCHRLVNTALAPEFETGLHALRIRTGY
jgi:BolA protein